MDKYKIFISHLALEDMDDIAKYIETQFLSPDTANDIIDTFYEAISSLAETPKRYSLVRDDFLANLGYRMMPVKNYVIFYSINESSKNGRVVNIERVLYKSRDWKRIIP